MSEAHWLFRSSIFERDSKLRKLEAEIEELKNATKRRTTDISCDGQEENGVKKEDQILREEVIRVNKENDRLQIKERKIRLDEENHTLGEVKKRLFAEMSSVLQEKNRLQKESHALREGKTRVHKLNNSLLTEKNTISSENQRLNQENSRLTQQIASLTRKTMDLQSHIDNMNPQHVRRRPSYDEPRYYRDSLYREDSPHYDPFLD
ncbi:hypothetical protein M011DRAFT_473796 [Sporormia fimetaria CBS 119925]|uniref:Uncharacterized protein n=1 Tax=Sporormia fimetaria CBS 119925 TaxID=1340428 RepID=A0A6A6VN93_9PLEO|nr:hypothetical protein M011DRAFT_473796 [Sporormia fimetaria CBS 119925]